MKPRGNKRTGLTGAAVTASIAGLAVFALFPVAASADHVGSHPPPSTPLDVLVKNNAGRAQPGVDILLNGAFSFSRRTDSSGTHEVNVRPGDVLHFTRGGEGHSCQPPEGYPGVKYTVPDPVPESQVVVKLPTIIKSTWGEGRKMSAEERRFVGFVNAAREKRGLEPLRISVNLSEASYFTAQRYNDKVPSFGCPNPWMAATDSGWSSTSFNGVWGQPALSAKQAFDNLRDRHDFLNRNSAVIGLAQYKQSWIVTTNTLCTASQCEVTNDTGIPPGAGGGGSNGGSGGGSALASKLRVKKILANGRRVKVVLRKRPAARGKIRVVAKKVGARKRKRMRVFRARSARPIARKPLGKGKWKIRVRFRGAEGWRSKRAGCRKIKVKPARRGSWRRLRMRPCCASTSAERLFGSCGRRAPVRVPTAVAVIVVLGLSGCGGGDDDDDSLTRDEHVGAVQVTADFCMYAAADHRRFRECLDQFIRRRATADILSMTSKKGARRLVGTRRAEVAWHAARYAFGMLDRCLPDAGPLCVPR